MNFAQRLSYGDESVTVVMAMVNDSVGQLPRCYKFAFDSFIVLVITGKGE